MVNNSSDPTAQTQTARPRHTQAAHKAMRNRIDALAQSAFMAALLERLEDDLAWTMALPVSSQLVRAIEAETNPQRLQTFLLCVRACLSSIAPRGVMCREELDAAIALYYLGARQAMQLEWTPMASNALVVQFPMLAKADYVEQYEKLGDPGLVMAAFVLSKLTAGIVTFSGTGEKRSPRNVHRFPLPENGDGSGAALDCALYAFYFPGDARALQFAEGHLVALLPDDAQRLKSEIERIHLTNSVVGLVLSNNPCVPHDTLQKLSIDYDLPLLLETSCAVEAALGLNPSKFLHGLRNLWKEETALRADELTEQLTTKEKQMGNTFNFNAPINGPVIAPSDNATANTHIQNGLDAHALKPLLESLAAAISRIQNEDAKRAYESNLQTIEAEIVSPVPDKSKLQIAFDALKQIPAFITGSAEAVTAATGLYKVLTPMLGLPPAP